MYHFYTANVVVVVVVVLMCVCGGALNMCLGRDVRCAA